MGVGTTWTNPATYPNPDLHTGDVITQTAWQLVLSNLNFLGGSDGATPTQGIAVRFSDTTLGADTASITVTVPALYKHLLIILGSLRSDRAAQPIDTIKMRFNGDSGANYDKVHINNTNATVTGANSLAQTEYTFSGVPAATATRAASGAVGLVLIPNHLGTTIEKSFFTALADIDAAAANTQLQVGSGSWRSTAAITSIVFSPSVGTNLKTGTRITAYGFN